jgi:hypothetical protein
MRALDAALEQKLALLRAAPVDELQKPLGVLQLVVTP